MSNIYLLDTSNNIIGTANNNMSSGFFETTLVFCSDSLLEWASLNKEFESIRLYSHGRELVTYNECSLRISGSFINLRFHDYYQSDTRTTDLYSKCTSYSREEKLKLLNI